MSCEPHLFADGVESFAFCLVDFAELGDVSGGRRGSSEASCSWNEGHIKAALSSDEA